MVKAYQQKIFMNPENESSNILKKFLQSLIKKGRKKKAQSLLLKVIRLVQMMQPTKTKYEVFTQAVKNVQPSFEFKRARLGGLYQMIPGAKKPEKQSNLAVRWILALAKEIRNILNDEFALITIGPAAYNRMYEKIGNVNKMLAWGHARAIENLLDKVPDCPRALSDKFGPSNRIKSALMEKGAKIE